MTLLAHPPLPLPHDVVLDNRRVPCALGLIRLREAIDTVAPGDVVVVLSRDRFAPVEIPLWAERAGHELLAVERVGGWPRRSHRIAVRRQTAEADPDGLRPPTNKDRS